MSTEKKVSGGRAQNLRKIVLILSVVAVITVASIVATLILIVQPPTPILSKMNISDAEYLFIAPGSAKRLFKITDENYIIEVTYEDENGEPMTMKKEPVSIYNIDDNYMIICFGLDDYNIDEGYLVRKNDGAVFSLENAGFPFVQPNHFKNDKTVYTDSSGNIYYRTALQEPGYIIAELVKLNTENMDSITKTTYSPTEEHVEGFIVDKNGSAPYYGRLKTEISGSKTIFRIRKANGGLYNLPSGTTNFWLGLDGVSYFLNSSGKIQKMSINSSYNVELIEYGSAYGPFYYNTYNSYKLALKDRIIIVDTSQGEIYEVYNPSEQPREINLTSSPIPTIRCAVASDNYYYLSGTDGENKAVLIQVNATDDSWTSLYAADTYDIYTMSVSSFDILLFNALRMSDGIKVIGEINATDSPAELSILDEISNTEMTVLERIA